MSEHTKRKSKYLKRHDDFDDLNDIKRHDGQNSSIELKDIYKENKIRQRYLASRTGATRSSNGMMNRSADNIEDIEKNSSGIMRYINNALNIKSEDEKPKEPANQLVDRSIQVDSHIDNHLNPKNKKKKKLTVKEKIILSGRPMCCTNMFIDKPCLIIILGMLILFGVTAFTIEREWYNQTPQTERQFLVFEDQTTKDWDMQVAAEGFLNSFGVKPVRVQNMPSWGTIIIYESKNGQNLLAKDTLMQIQKFEKKIIEDEDFQQLCLAESASDESCSSQAFVSGLSFLTQFDE